MEIKIWRLDEPFNIEKKIKIKKYIIAFCKDILLNNLANSPQLFYIEIYRTTHHNFYYYFTIKFWRSLTGSINQSITEYKVLNLVKVPYP